LGGPLFAAGRGPPALFFILILYSRLLNTPFPLDKRGDIERDVLIGKDDLLIYRINFAIRPKIKPGALPKEFPVPDDMMQKIDVKFSKWDEENPFEIPAVVKAKWGIK